MSAPSQSCPRSAGGSASQCQPDRATCQVGAAATCSGPGSENRFKGWGLLDSADVVVVGSVVDFGLGIDVGGLVVAVLPTSSPPGKGT